MRIGIPKEIKTDEGRVALIPEDCKYLVEKGCEVYLENNAGQPSGFDNHEYEQAGVVILPEAKTLYDACELIVKVKEPQASEIKSLKNTHTLFCFLHLGGNHALAETLRNIGLTAYAFETVQENGLTPLLSPMSQIAGHLSILFSSNFLTTRYQGRGILLGRNPVDSPGKILVLGAGMAGMAAIELAHKMGVELYVADINKTRLDEIQKKFPDTHTFISDNKNISQVLPEIDVLIGAVYVYGKTAPVLVSRQMIQSMKRGSVAFDIAVDQGGCFETTHPCTHTHPTYIECGVVHSAIANLPSAVCRSASINLSSQIRRYVYELSSQQISNCLLKGLNIKDRNFAIEF